MRKLGMMLVMGVALITFSCDNEEPAPCRPLAEQMAIDIEIIDNYLDANGIVAQTHQSGLRYVIVEEGTGDRATTGNSVNAKYKGTLLSNGKKFDESKNGITFALSRVILGWQYGIPLIKEGGKIILYIPSKLGYDCIGSQGSIPGNANLVFEVELVDVI